MLQIVRTLGPQRWEARPAARMRSPAARTTHEITEDVSGPPRCPAEDDTGTQVYEKSNQRGQAVIYRTIPSNAPRTWGPPRCIAEDDTGSQVARQSDSTCHCARLLFCQVAILPGCQVAILPGCHIAGLHTGRLPPWHIARMKNNDFCSLESIKSGVNISSFVGRFFCVLVGFVPC